MLKLTFLGDLFPGDEDLSKGFGILSKTRDNQKLWAENLQNVAGQADYIVGNLEGPLLEQSDGKTFCGCSTFADILKNAGINILNIANNHITEHGEEGVSQTLSILKNRGLLATGTVTNEQPQFLTIQKQGTKVCLAGFCDERICTMGHTECYANLTESIVFETLNRIKETAPDVIILIFHWGDEYIKYPSLEQRQLAYRLIDQGVDLVVGHHPHVIQPYEKYKDGHIIYSLGNACFNDVPSKSLGRGMSAHITIQDKAIQKLEFKGLLVQDISYSDDLVKPMSKSLFTSYFTRINQKYVNLCKKADSAYQDHYNKNIRHRHRVEMTKTRMDLILKAINPKNRNRKAQIRNIKQYLHNKHNNSLLK